MSNLHNLTEGGGQVERKGRGGSRTSGDGREDEVYREAVGGRLRREGIVKGRASQ